MKVIIAGGRNFIPTDTYFYLIKRLIKFHNITEIVSGTQRGADKFGEDCSELYLGKKATLFPPDWSKYNLGAGPRRNAEMAKYADAIILLPGGKGTNNMRKLAAFYRLDFLYDSKTFDKK